MESLSSDRSSYVLYVTVQHEAEVSQQEPESLRFTLSSVKSMSSVTKLNNNGAEQSPRSGERDDGIWDLRDLQGDEVMQTVQKGNLWKRLMIQRRAWKTLDVMNVSDHVRSTMIHRWTKWTVIWTRPSCFFSCFSFHSTPFSHDLGIIVRSFGIRDANMILSVRY